MPFLPKKNPGQFRFFGFPNPRDASLVLLASLLALLLNGYGYGIRDSELYIPMVEHAANPAKFAGDYLFSEPTAEANFWVPAMGLLNRFIPTETLFFGGYCISLILLFAAILALCRTLFPDRRDALFAMAFLVPWKPVGGALIQTIEGVYTLRAAAMPFAVAFLAAWFGKRHRTAALWAAATFLIHPLTGFPLAILLLAGLLVDTRPGRLLRAAKTSGIYALGVSPLLFKVLLSAFSSSGQASFLLSVDPLWLAIVRDRLEYLFLSRWTPQDILLVAGYGGLLVAALCYRRLLGVSGEKDQLAWALVLSCAAILLADWIFVDLFPVAMVIELQPLRSLYLIVFAAMVFAGWMAGEGVRGPGELEPAPIAGRRVFLLALARRIFPLLMVVLLVSRHHGHFLAALVIASGWGALHGRRLPVGLRKALGIAAVSILILGLMVGQLEADSEIGLVLIAVFLFLKLFPGRFRIIAPGPAGATWAALVVVALLSVGTGLLEGSLSKRLSMPGLAADTPFSQVARWCRDHTPEDSVFLVPPDSRGFRVFSGRSMVGTIKDGGPAVFSKAFMSQWLDRMMDLEGYEHFDADRFLALGKKYGAGYAIDTRDRIPGLRPLVTNGHYTVYALPEPSPALPNR